MSRSIKSIIGCAGVEMHPKNEERIVRWIAFFLQTLILGIDIWLPLQGWLYYENYFTMRLLMITTWCFWSGFMVISFTQLLLVKHKLRFLIDNWLYLPTLLIAFPIFWLFGDNYYSAYVWKLLVISIISFPWMIMLSSMISEKRIMFIIILFTIYGILGGFFVTYIDHGIANPWVGVWFAFQTVTGIGYGAYPQTYLGQAFALVFMYGCIALITILSSTFAFHLLKNHFTEKTIIDRDLLIQHNQTQSNRKNKTKKTGKKKSLVKKISKRKTRTKK